MTMTLYGRGVMEMTFSEDDPYGSLEEDVDIENDLEGNLELEDNEGSSDDMIRRAVGYLLVIMILMTLVDT